MEALEFSAKIENGMIRLPKRFGLYEDAFVRVIVIASKPKEILDKKKKLAALFKKMRDKDIFSKITNPVEWQKSIRNEWE